MDSVPTFNYDGWDVGTIDVGYAAVSDGNPVLYSDSLAALLAGIEEYEESFINSARPPVWYRDRHGLPVQVPTHIATIPPAAVLVPSGETIHHGDVFHLAEPDSQFSLYDLWYVKRGADVRCFLRADRAEVWLTTLDCGVLGNPDKWIHSLRLNGDAQNEPGF